jgi:hypothetical protein
LDEVYEITVVPLDRPVTTPDAETLATEVLLLLHEPLVTVLVSVVVSPIQMLSRPEIVPATGIAITVTGYMLSAVPQPLVTEYVTIAEPTETPVTTPAVTEATAMLPLAQVPPLIVDDNVVVAPTQTVLLPEMTPADGSGLTVIVSVATAVPQLFVTE